MNNNSIAIFDSSLKVIAFIDLNPNTLEATRFISKSDADLLMKFLQSLKTEILGVRVEAISDNNKYILTSRVVEPNSEDYSLALLEQLKSHGFMAQPIPSSVKPILEQISEKLSEEQLREVIGDIVNLPQDVDAETSSELLEILEEAIMLDQK